MEASILEHRAKANHSAGAGQWHRGTGQTGYVFER